MTDHFNNLWIERYRPKTFEDIVLSNDDRIFFETLKLKGEIPHLLFAGVQGSGKTSLSKIIINDILKCEHLYINASDETGIDTIRSKVIGFARTKSFDGKIKIVLLDECDSISFEAMKALRNTIEEFSATCRFILTCNYLHKVIAPIQSRCQIINLNPPLDKTVERIAEILKKENITIPAEQKPLLLKRIKQNLPDLRRIINDVQKYSSSGILNIKSDSSQKFADLIFKKLEKKVSVLDLRKEIIENEKAFSNDYRSLLKELFEATYKSNISQEKKIECLLTISKGLEADCMVIDKEINAFSALINLSKII